MAKPLWSAYTSFLPFTITSVTTEATNYPSSRLTQVLPHPIIRRWRSTNTSQQNIICDLGSSKSVAGVALFGANFRRYTLAHSADNSSYTPVTGTEPDIGQDGIDGYYKVFMQTAFTNRYLRVKVNAASNNIIYDSASYFTLGAVVIFSTINTWPRDIPVPYDITLQRSYMQSGNDIVPAGPFFIEQEIKTILARTEISSLQTIGLLGEHLPILWYRNAGNDTSAVYLLRYKGGMKYTKGLSMWEASPSFQELV